MERKMKENQAIPSKAFSALSGAEIIEIFTKQLRAAMEADDSFAPHITFPVVEAQWSLTFRAYPGRNSVTPIEMKVDLKAQGTGELPELQEPIVGEKKGELITDTPDAERVKHGMGVPRPEKVGGRFCDVKVIEKPLPEIPRMDD